MMNGKLLEVDTFRRQHLVIYHLPFIIYHFNITAFYLSNIPIDQNRQQE